MSSSFSDNDKCHVESLLLEMTRPCWYIWENMKFEGLPTFFFHCQGKSCCWLDVQFFVKVLHLSLWIHGSQIQGYSSRIKRWKLWWTTKSKKSHFQTLKGFNSIDFSVFISKWIKHSWISWSSFFDFDGRLAAVADCGCCTQKKNWFGLECTEWRRMLVSRCLARRLPWSLPSWSEADERGRLRMLKQSLAALTDNTRPVSMRRFTGTAILAWFFLQLRWFYWSASPFCIFNSQFRFNL